MKTQEIWCRKNIYIYSLNIYSILYI